MKLRDIDRLLPNGFHDATLNKILTDYSENKSVFEMEVLSPNQKGEMEYRHGYLLLSKVFFIVIEPPDSNYDYVEKEMFVSFGDLKQLDKERISRLPLTSLSNTAFVNWFFISSWNSFIYVSAEDAEFRWGTIEKPGEILTGGPWGRP